MAENTDTEVLESQTVPAHVDPADHDLDLAHDDAVPEVDLPDPSDADTPEPSPARSEPERRGGLVPFLLGGAMAAAGFAGATYLNREPAFDPAPLQGQIADLQGQLDAVPAPVDLSGVETQIAQMQDTFDQNLADLRERSETTQTALDAMETRLSQVEMRGEAGQVDRTALDAYQRELADMRALVEAQAEQLGAATASATAQLADAQAAAEQARLRADASAALSVVETALTQGGGYTDALPALAAMTDLPEALTTHAETGVATLASLQSDLPAAARAALSQARDAGEAGEDGGGRMGAFLRSQFSVRATAPQDGDSANAVLSRIESATRAGDLDTALTEYAGLPASAQTALAEWAGAAQQRADVTAAVETLSQSLTEK